MPEPITKLNKSCFLMLGSVFSFTLSGSLAISVYLVTIGTWKARRKGELAFYRLLETSPLQRLQKAGKAVPQEDVTGADGILAKTRPE